MAMRSTTSVHHWRFEDGTREDSVGNLWKHDPMPRGWYCWVYPKDNCDFDDWMTKNCPSADVTFRFNSGDPMYTVYIKDDNEATLFGLRWM
jgi:hypothetical protein